MRVLLAHSSSSAGSVHHRITEPARAVLESGADVDVRVRMGIPTSVSASGDQEPEVIGVETGDADVVVLQLPKTLAMLQTIRVLQARGVAVVVEVDDLLSGVPYGHPAHRTLVRGGMARMLAECAREADFVT